MLRVEEDQIPVKRQNLENQLHKLEMEEQELIEKEEEVRQRAFNEALLKVQEEKDRREKMEAKNKRNSKNSTPPSTGRQKRSTTICAHSKRSR